MSKKEEQEAAAGCGCLMAIVLLLFLFSPVFFLMFGKTEADRAREHELKMEELRLKYQQEKPK